MRLDLEILQCDFQLLQCVYKEFDLTLLEFQLFPFCFSLLRKIGLTAKRVFPFGFLGV